MSFLLQLGRISVPYALAALGGVLSERGGIINLALEGTLLAGAFGTALGATYSGDLGVGILCGMGAGVGLQLLLGLCSLGFGASSILSGLAVNLLALSGTRFLLKLCFGSAAESPRIAQGRGSLFIAVAAGAAGLVYLVLYHTRFGLRLRACGESSTAARSMGISVGRVRLGGLVWTGMLAGLGGVYLALDQHKFVDNMSAGRGYVALAAVVLSGWRPVRAALVCLGFGLAEAIEIKLQTLGWGLPSELVRTLPYLLTLVALAMGTSRSRAPAGLG